MVSRRGVICDIRLNYLRQGCQMSDDIKKRENSYKGCQMELVMFNSIIGKQGGWR